VDTEAYCAAYMGYPDALRAALDQKELQSWDFIMSEAVRSGSLDCVKVLYDKGYEQRRSTEPNLHLAVFAVLDLELEVLRFVVDRSGPPQAGMLCGAYAVGGGMEVLRYVWELGGVFDEWATETAARQGDLEALQYLHMNGAPWDSGTLSAAVMADSLPCLQYAHMHACPQEVHVAWGFHQLQARSLPVLRHVCEHMDPAFASKTLEYTAKVLADEVIRYRGRGRGWLVIHGASTVALYLGRKLGAGLPEALAEAKATLTERAVALAGVFKKAEKQLRAEETRLLHREAAGGEEGGIITPADAERMALWDAMARVPKELQELIAVKAHLIML
jgi:hypothetical protein